MTVADDFDILLIDLDGVVYLGGEPLPGAVDSLNRLGRMGKTIRYLTNDPQPRRETVARHLRDLGVRVDAEEIVTSAWAAAGYLDHVGVGTASAWDDGIWPSSRSRRGPGASGRSGWRRTGP